MFAIGIRVQKTFWNFDSFIDSLIKKTFESISSVPRTCTSSVSDNIVVLVFDEIERNCNVTCILSN